MWHIRHHLLLVQPHMAPIETSEWFSRSVSCRIFCSHPNEKSRVFEWLWAEPHTFVWELGWMKGKMCHTHWFDSIYFLEASFHQKRFLNFAEPHQWTAYNLRTQMYLQSCWGVLRSLPNLSQNCSFSQGRKRNLFSTGKSIIFTASNEIHLTLLKYKLKLNQI